MKFFAKYYFTLQGVLLFLTACTNISSETSYYETGEIKSKCYLKEPNLEVCTLFYKNSNVECVQTFYYGKRHGIYKEYYENGTLKIFANFKNDILEGQYFELHKNGRLSKKRYFINGKMEGKGYTYTQGGVMCEDLFYENDTPRIQGLWHVTDNNEYLIQFKYHVIGIDAGLIGKMYFRIKDGSLDKDRSFYYSVEIIRDTIAFGETFEAIFDLYPMEKDSRFRVIFGDFSTKNHKIEFQSQEIDTVYVLDKGFRYQKKATIKGRQVLKGIIYEHNNDSLPGSTRIIPIYLEYFVR
jgi:antitoxin component YwqK of YwqJK toxin-antitoxin module